LVDVADAKGNWKEPDISSILKNGENAAYGILSRCLNDVEIMPI